MRKGATVLKLVFLAGFAPVIFHPAEAAAPTQPPNRDLQWKQCNGSPGTSIGDQVAACTARIQSGQENPNEVFVAYYNRALAKYRQEQYGGAADDYGAALRIKSGDAEAWAGLGLSEFHLNRFSNAVTDFGHA